MKVNDGDAKIKPRMVLKMFFNKEHREMKKIISYCMNALTDEQKKKWPNWCKRRDIVAKDMGLTETEVLQLTVAMIANLCIIATYQKYGYGDWSKERLENTKGTTKAIKEANGYAKIAREYEAKTADIQQPFFNRVSALKNKLDSNDEFDCYEFVENKDLFTNNTRR